MRPLCDYTPAIYHDDTIGGDQQNKLSKIMPDELSARGCANSKATCDAGINSLQGAVPENAAQSSDEIIRRLGSA